jgi:t-SNARE complex subunit (syntaxin)
VQRRSLERERASKAALEETAAAQSPSGHDQQQLQSMEEPRLAQQAEVDYQENLIIEREVEIRQIEQSVGELNELFRDVAHIVREQGDMLDVIDVNVENTLSDTRGADADLRSASRYQKAARNKACCLLLIMAIILIIVILAVVVG